MNPVPLQGTTTLDILRSPILVSFILGLDIRRSVMTIPRNSELLPTMNGIANLINLTNFEYIFAN